MKYVISRFALLLTVTTLAAAQSHPAYLGSADPAAEGPSSQISGCLLGTPGGYRLIAVSGHSHLLIGDEAALPVHVGDRVTLQGYRDVNRDASASSDEGTAHGMRFFQVNQVSADTGRCNVR